MSDFTTRRLRFASGKASPAECAITAVSVRIAEPLKLNTVYEHPGARYRPNERDDWPTKTAHTVSSGSSTYQMLWEDPARTGSESDTSILDLDEADDEVLDPVSRDPSPMGQVKTKLAAWSWAREEELDEDGYPKWIPLMAFDESRQPNHLPSIIDPVEEEPPAPPNTERASGASSARHSGLQSPLRASMDEEDDDRAPDDVDDGEDVDRESPIELRVKASLARPSSSPAVTDYLTAPSHSRSLPFLPHPGGPKPSSRQMSNLAAEEQFFRLHRDSVELTKRKMNEDRMNHQLMNAHNDSFVLIKSKYDSKAPKSGASTISWSRFGGLTPIVDASPPDARAQAGVRAMSRLAGLVAHKEDETTHPDEHVGCSICEVDRPKWFEAKYAKYAKYAKEHGETARSK